MPCVPFSQNSADVPHVITARVARKEPIDCALSSSMKSGESSTGNTQRNLYLVADNAADNKNMDVIAFCCELVSQPWFNVVEFAFGEVGHTHNGEDAAHHVLNQNVGCYVALTLGEHVLNYEKVWDDPRTRPEAVLVQDQYDWKQRYAPREVVQRIAGFTKTKLDPEVVHAFQVRRSQTGAVEVVWKKRAADTTWLGHDGQPAMQADGRGSTGFMCLKKVPTQPLDLAPWNNQLVDKRYIPELRGPAMSVLCSESYMDGHAQQWILDTIEKGRVEAHSVAIFRSLGTEDQSWSAEQTRHHDSAAAY